MRPINADAIQYDQLLKTGNKEHPLEWAVSQSLINSMPTIKIEPIKHGKWIYIKKRSARGGYVSASECSVCHKIIMPHLKPNYCPNCGARMDEEDTNANETL